MTARDLTEDDREDYASESRRARLLDSGEWFECRCGELTESEDRVCDECAQETANGEGER